MIFQSSRAMAGGVMAARVCWARPSVLTYVAFFSVYAAAGRTISAIAAPASPCEPEMTMCPRYRLLFWIKIVPDITYNVFGGTLNLAQSITR